MLKIGHRGARGLEPENTLASFKRALDLGVGAIELDVYLSKDGKLIVMHDPLVNRTTNGSGFISRKTLQELKKLDAGKGEKVPTLEEVLDFINRKAQVNIELKGGNTPPAVAKIIMEYVTKKGWKYSDFFVSSFSAKLIREFKAILPQVRIGIIIIGLRIQYDKYVEMDAFSFALWSKLVRRSVVEKAHKKGLKIFAWTVNSKKESERMKALGVDGIFSDYPDRI